MEQQVGEIAPGIWRYKKTGKLGRSRTPGAEEAHKHLIRRWRKARHFRTDMRVGAQVTWDHSPAPYQYATWYPCTVLEIGKRIKIKFVDEHGEEQTRWVEKDHLYYEDST